MNITVLENTTKTEEGKYTVVRMWPKTLTKLRVLKAITGVQIVIMMDKMVTQELARVQEEMRKP